MRTLNEQYQLLKEGKGHKDVFLKEARRKFPQWIRNASTLKETTTILLSTFYIVPTSKYIKVN